MFPKTKPEYQHRTSGNVPQKLDEISDESCFTTDTFVPPEVKKLQVTDVLKTYKHYVGIDFFCSGFSSYEHFNRQYDYAIFFKCKTLGCVSKKMYANTLLVFCAAWDASPSENIFYVIT